ncbi:hypothetical protein [Litoreibacter arenae]|uniref:Uncharacterized protein n=1 Tax=Litoreibacter arenae DSM 19593 TaxID=1123360 RepID=S9RU63_9RHOB|nr:hypothetical protein [Litoreibacter arenae]EPX77484.1 hypothetical protein thalar_03207 [Litoreibacter arenae DSM 19593]
MKHVLDKSSTTSSDTAKRQAFAFEIKSMPSSATLALQRRKKAAPKDSGRPQQYSRIERGIQA